MHVIKLVVANHKQMPIIPGLNYSMFQKKNNLSLHIEILRRPNAGALAAV